MSVSDRPEPLLMLVGQTGSHCFIHGSIAISDRQWPTGLASAYDDSCSGAKSLGLFDQECRAEINFATDGATVASLTGRSSSDGTFDATEPYWPR